MDIEEIRTKYYNGDYKYIANIPVKVSLNHVFDEELSVKRNRELVEEHNAKVDAMLKDKRAKQQELTALLANDVVTYIVDTYELSIRQARAIESFTYQEKHACMSDYFSYIDIYADLANELLTCEEPVLL